MIALTLALAIQTAAPAQAQTPAPAPAATPDYEGGAQYFGQAIFIGSVCTEAGALALDTAQLEETFNIFNREAELGGMTKEAIEAAMARGMAHEKARAGLLFTPGWEERRDEEAIASYLSRDCDAVIQALPNAFSWAQDQASAEQAPPPNDP